MSDERLDRIENMLEQLIRIVGSTNEAVSKISGDLSEFKQDTSDRLDRIEKELYRLHVVERRQDRLVSRVDRLETEMELRNEQ